MSMDGIMVATRSNNTLEDFTVGCSSKQEGTQTHHHLYDKQIAQKSQNCAFGLMKTRVKR